ncbi:hypothetical protein [Fangia hongkongensis]|uniref:hypothetical protein n=1 Tax=Fangia hongkongensis TaxID=270495 RepID=UPI00036FF621|nr:hypothetical protein [Fangia hongkongensis]MBK2125999.1 hypothetical protein [Fangia hongkongensis]
MKGKFKNIAKKYNLTASESRVNGATNLTLERSQIPPLKSVIVGKEALLLNKITAALNQSASSEVTQLLLDGADIVSLITQGSLDERRHLTLFYNLKNIMVPFVSQVENEVKHLLSSQVENLAEIFKHEQAISPQNQQYDFNFLQKIISTDIMSPTPYQAIDAAATQARQKGLNLHSLNRSISTYQQLVLVPIRALYKYHRREIYAEDFPRLPLIDSLFSTAIYGHLIKNRAEFTCSSQNGRILKPVYQLALAELLNISMPFKACYSYLLLQMLFQPETTYTPDFNITQSKRVHIWRILENTPLSNFLQSPYEVIEEILRIIDFQRSYWFRYIYRARETRTRHVLSHNDLFSALTSLWSGNTVPA